MINILGQDYQLVIQSATDNPKLEDADGLCEVYSKKLVLCLDYAEDPKCYENIYQYSHKVLRHEAFHAFLAEMGVKKWFNDEELVDMLAMQYPKIRAIMDKCDSLDLKEIKCQSEKLRVVIDMAPKEKSTDQGQKPKDREEL